MRIGVLAATESWYFRDLLRAAGNEHELTCLEFTKLQAAITHDFNTAIHCGETELSDFSAVLVRTMPPGTLEQVVFRMDLLARLEASGTVVLNSPRAVEAAVDKFLTTAKLAAAGLPTPRTLVCETAEAALAAFDSLGGNIVLKPLFGSEGRGLMHITDVSLGERSFRVLEQLGAVLYLQEFIEHPGCDYRVFLIGEQSYSMVRRNPHDWRTNVSRGATTELWEPPPHVLELARRSAQAVGAEIAGVDLLQNRSGDWFVIEVNAVPGWKALAATHQRDIAREVLAYTASRVRMRQGGAS